MKKFTDEELSRILSVCADKNGLDYVDPEYRSYQQGGCLMQAAKASLDTFKDSERAMWFDSLSHSYRTAPPDLFLSILEKAGLA